MRESQALMNKLFWMKKVLFLDHMWSANVCIFENTEQYDNKVVNDKERLKSEGQLNSFCFGKRQDRFFAVVFLLSFSFGDHPFFWNFFLFHDNFYNVTSAPVHITGISTFMRYIEGYMLRCCMLL